MNIPMRTKWPVMELKEAVARGGRVVVVVVFVVAPAVVVVRGKAEGTAAAPSAAICAISASKIGRAHV